MDSDWEHTLEEEREAKDDYLANHPHSPIPEEERRDFEGLAYFPPDPDLRFELALERFDERDTLTIETTQDGERTYLRWGQFRFQVEGRTCTLTAYKQEPEDEHLWVPFRDETSGEETYPAGRYVDLDEGDQLDDGWVLDLNRAYSPFCAFSDAYECPLVPMENWLDVRVEAGEKAPVMGETPT